MCIKRVIFVFVSFLFLCACTEKNNKEKFLNNFEDFVLELEADTSRVKNWNEIALTFEKYNVELLSIHERNLTPKEMEKIGNLEAKYFKAVVINEINSAADEVMDEYKSASGFIKEILNDNE